MNLAEFFDTKYNSDVKIKILVELDLKTIKYLCLISPGCLALCQSAKFWKRGILKYYSMDALPSQTLTTADWVNLYSRLILCRFSKYYRGKFVYCHGEIIRPAHSKCLEHGAIGYCQYHVDPHCTYIMTKGRNRGKRCEKYSVKALNTQATEPGCELYCSICLRKKSVQLSIHPPLHVEYPISPIDF